jgi:integrase/recombinase XerC
MILTQAIDRYAARYTDRNAHTLRAKKYDLGYFLGFCLAANIKKLPGITPSIVAQFVAERFGLGEAPRTVQRRLNNVRAFLNWCAHQYRDFENPMPEVRQVSVPAATPKWLDDTELEQLRHQILTGDHFRDLRNTAIIELLARAGLRRAEVVNLNINQLDMKNWTIKNVRRKGDIRQTIVLHDSVIAALESYLPERSKFLAASRADGFASTVQPSISRALPLFISKHSADFRMSSEAIYNIVRAAARRAGLTVHPHNLRHTFVNDVLTATKDIRVAAAAAGHTNINTTMLYTQPKEQQIRDALARVK